MNSPTYSTSTGGFPLGHHLEMIQDKRRVDAIKSAIDVHSSSQREFLEIGFGSGIFIKYALQKFKNVVGFEKDPCIFDLAQNTLSETQDGRLEIFMDDFLNVNLRQKFDVVLCELLSTWCIIEDQVRIMNHAVSSLDLSTAEIIPVRITNLMELAYTSFSVDQIEVRAPFLQLTGVRQPLIMSTGIVVNEIYFSSRRPNPNTITGSAEMMPLAHGIINSVRLTSFVELAHGVNWHSSDTLMPQMVFPLKRDVTVARGRALFINYSVEFGGGLDRAHFWAE